MNSVAMRIFVVALVVAFVATATWSYPANPVEPFEQNPEEIAGLFEGDMDLDAYQQFSLEHPQLRNGLVNPIYRWQNGIVHYEIDDMFDEDHRNHILKGLGILESVSCLKFFPRTPTTKDYIYVTGSGSGCFSSVGRRGNRQTLNLQLYPLDEGCFRIGTIVHEFLHALGFYHQQSTYDRDNFVTIVAENIQDGTQHNFNKYNVLTVLDYGVPYDYESVMHYPSLAFSKNGQMTIIPKDPNAAIGQRLKMSDADVEKLNAMYHCPAAAL